MKKIFHQILSSPGEIVSFSELNKRGLFKKTIEQRHGKRLMEHVADEMDELHLGGVLPYMGYIGMCRCEGYAFQAVYSSIGYINQSVWV